MKDINNRIVVTDSLSIGYGKTIVVDNINISIEEGKILTLIGANGSGKSTLLKTMTKELNEVSGAIYIDGIASRDIDEKELSKKLSMVMSKRIHTEMMSCREVVETGRYPYTGHFGILSDKDRKIVDDIMEQVNIKQIADKDFNKISDGQRQRVMLGRALCQEPRILVLDEPTSFLDLKYKLEILKLIRNIATTKKIAVIMSLHELDLASKISDTLVCIKDGKIDKVGSPEEVLSDDYVNELFDIREGNFSASLGLVNLKNIDDEDRPKYFVLGGNSSYIYNLLNRKSIAFSAGILYDNEVSYQVAKGMTKHILCGKAFTKVEESIIEKAKEYVDNSEKVLCVSNTFGEYDNANKIIFEYAKSKGKLGEIKDIL